MSRKDTIDHLFVKKAEGQAASASGDLGRVRTTAISAMGASLKELTESAASASKLKESVENGSSIVELDPNDIDASMVTDRLMAEIDPGFDALVESIRMSGQQVPILVRPSPDAAGRYQIAYGHRRMRAVAKIGIKVRAIMRPLTDSELVIAQGKENLDRKDLSYIEKALFARKLEDQGFDRTVIMAALSTDKGDLSRYISIAKTIPEDVVRAVGPAGKAGRARWIALSEKLPHRRNVVDKAIESEEFKRLDSDARFSFLLSALTERPAAISRVWINDRGQRAGQAERKQDRLVLTIDEKVAPEFGEFLFDRLNELYAEFLQRQERDAA